MKKYNRLKNASEGGESTCIDVKRMSMSHCLVMFVSKTAAYLN